MSSRMARHDNRDIRRDVSPRLKRRRFTEVPEPRDRRSPYETNRHKEQDRGAHYSKEFRRRSRSGSRSGLRKEHTRTEKRYRESPPREKRKFKEERENDEPKRKRSPNPQELPKEVVAIDDDDESDLLTRRFDQTEFLLNDRFSALSTSRHLVVEENVSVEIERKIAGKENFKIPKVLDPRAVIIPKTVVEGREALTSREEFKGRRTTLPGDSWQQDRSFGGRGLEKRIIRPAGDVSADQGLVKERRAKEDWNGSPVKDRNRFSDHHIDRQRASEDGTNLPDFSKRPGKYSYEAWKDKPEMIPKGRSYFEHDMRDREAEDSRRSQGNGGNWPQGRAPRGRGGGYRRQGDSDTWKHDKFEELLVEEGEEAT